MLQIAPFPRMHSASWLAGFGCRTHAFATSALVGLLLCGAVATQEPTAQASPPASLDGTRLAMTKWLETQQIIGRERREWQQGKEVLAGRIELAKKEIAALEAKIAEANAAATKAKAEREQLIAQNEGLKATSSELLTTVAGLENDVRQLHPRLPEPVQARIAPLFTRMPTEPTAAARLSVAERFQNVLGILGDANKANAEISVGYEVRALPDGRRAEVQAIYVGLGQAYYIGQSGVAGIGRPGATGWQWEPVPATAGNVLTALEVIQGKQTPAFVPLPVQIQ